MKSSKQSKREAKELFRCCLVDGLLDANRVRLVVQKVIAAKPRGYLATLEAFERLLQLDQQRRTARIESAVPLAPDLQGRIKASLERVYGRGLDISFAQSPALIGGMRIKVGSDVYDGSVQARLAALQESF